MPTKKKTKKKATKTRPRGFPLTVDQAVELEQLLGEYVNEEAGDDDAFRVVRNLLRQAGAPAAFVKDLKQLADAVGGNIEVLRNEVTRMNIEDVILTLKSLDGFLSKNTKVTSWRLRSGSYVWEVWNW